MSAEGEELPPELARAMAGHLADEHGLEVDVTAELARSESRLSWQPASPAQSARFRCALCPGKVFPFGEPAAGPERNAYLRLHDPGLRAQLTGVPTERQDEFIEAWQRGEIQTSALDRASARRRMATAARRSPEAARRRAAAQEYLLEARARLGTVDAAIHELIELAEADPVRHLRIMGRTTPMAAETLRKYWQGIAEESRRKTGPLAAENIRRRS